MIIINSAQLSREVFLGTTLYISSSGGDKLWRLHDLVRTESMIFFLVKLLIICAVHCGSLWLRLFSSGDDDSIENHYYVQFWTGRLTICSVLDIGDWMIERSVSKL